MEAMPDSAESGQAPERETALIPPRWRAAAYGALGAVGLFLL